MTSSTVKIDDTDGGRRVGISGDLLIGTISTLRRQSRDLSGEGEIEIDLSGVERMDTGGAWFVIDLTNRLEAGGARTKLAGASALHSRIIEAIRVRIPEPPEHSTEARGFVAWLFTIGRRTVTGWESTREILSLLGQVVAGMISQLLRPWRIRLPSVVSQMQEVGINATPIVVVMTFLIGVVLEFQGAAELQAFGADIYVVDLVGTSILRELGILLTAIIVAGRTGSAFTSAIGSMKMREEIDAMRTLGLDPIEVLVLPRVLALMLMLPVLGVIADVVGLAGSALMAWGQLGISPEVFVTRLKTEVTALDYASGLVKAPFFAAIIGVVGCYKGLKTGGDAESLGRRTSQSVVMAIFLVIAADSVFSVFFALVGI